MSNQKSHPGVGGRLMAFFATSLLVVAACGPAAPGPASTTAPGASGAGSNAPILVGQPTSAPAVPGPNVASTAEPKAGGRVILGDITDIKTLNPVLVSDVSSDVVTSRVFAGLLSVDAKTGEVQPNLAEKYDFSSDGKTLTFQLRDGLKFSDGSTLTADDFVFSVMALLRSKKTNHKNNVDQIVGAREFIDGSASGVSGINVDGNTITVTMVNPFCPALVQIGALQIIPKSVYGKYIDPGDPSKNLDDAPENNAPPVSSGAFLFKEWLPNDHVTLVRNDNYWQPAKLDEWVHKAYPNRDTLTAALKVGEVDMSIFDPKDLQDVQNVGTVQVFKWPELGYTYIGWNQLRGGKEFLQDKAVRQALTYGLNVQQVVDKVLFGEGVKMVGQIPPVSWAYDASGLNTYDFDPAKAEQLLQDDGWTKGDDGIYAKDGQPLSFSMTTNSGNVLRETFVQVAAEQYKQIGVDAQPKTESFEALVDRSYKSKDPTYGDQGGHDFDAIVIGWSLTSDPDMYSIWDSNSTHAGENNTIQYKNSDLDKAIDDSRTHCGQADRKDALKRANTILNEEQPYNFGFAQNILFGVNRKVQNVNPGPYSRLGQAKPETWWVQ
jgi:peptide/nickel transport system substrate-binding protein